LSEEAYDRRVQACALCGSRERRKVLEGRDQRFGAPGVFRVARCETCGLMFQEPMPAQEEIEAFCEAPRSSRAHSLLFDGYAKIVNSSRARLLSANKPHGKLLDIGCGTGDFLVQARKREWDITGVELSANACQAAEKRLGASIYHGELKELGLPSGWFDAVTLWHVFEHIPSPNELMQEIYRILKPGGAMIVEVPNIHNPVYGLFGRYYLHLDLPRHVYFYDPDTLKAMVEKHGFIVVREDAPSWYYPEGITKSTGYLLSRAGVEESALRKMMSVLLYPASLLVTSGYLTATLFGASSEVIRIVATKPHGNSVMP
jgi:ubiquinone/menaquinone biosynthesis C-methylase UbiE